MAESAERTRSDVFRIIEDGLAAGKYPGVKEKAKGGYAPGTIAGDLQEYFGERKSHATTVARTETGRILNLGQLQRYKDRGIAYVKVLDDEGPHSCAACAAANGQVWTLDYAMEHELEHPNCVRAYVAVRD
jgi:SPP1 gp7 family putative phage head morphogenesis protein